jgi:hypothetical protein
LRRALAAESGSQAVIYCTLLSLQLVFIFQNSTELKKDAGNTAISILGIVGGHGQVTGAKKMLDLLQQYPKTFAKRMFIELKKNFMRKLTWAPRTLAAMFK